MNMDSNFDKKNPFLVPDGYFEDFAAKMASMTQTSVPAISWYRKTKYWIAVAAVLSGILIGTKLLMPQATEPLLEGMVQQPTAEESYILNQIDDSNLVNLYAEETTGSAQ
jgi:hypothetical protein